MTVRETRGHAQTETGSLRATWFDSVTSFLMACILLLGCIVAVLFLVWIVDDQESEIKPNGPIVRARNASAGIQVESDFDSPEPSEIRDITDVTVEEMVSSLSTVAAKVAISTENSEDFASQRLGQSTNGGATVRRVGSEDIVPRHQRWVVKFKAKTMSDYAKQLDFHAIELGAIGGSIQGVDCVSQVSGTTKYRRIIETKKEKRLYFMWQQETAFSKWDKQLLNRANIPLADRHVLKFIPPELENSLAVAELRYATDHGHPSVRQIAKTIFESQLGPEGYAFVIVDQRYEIE